MTIASKETLKEVKKVWGGEIWIVNCEKYCGKLLLLDKGAISSIHYHKIKQETFYALSGQTALHIDGKDYMLNPASRPKTIYPKQEHQFTGLSEDIVILEISTHHEENDVVRLTQSQKGDQWQCSKFIDILGHYQRARNASKALDAATLGRKL